LAEQCCVSVVERHVSIRKFSSRPVPEETVEKILEAAMRAPSAWNLQPYVMMVIRDEEKKSALADLVGGQEHVAQAPLVIVFAVDYAKIVKAAEKLGFKLTPSLAHLYEALVDVGIASAWALAAAESMGLGGVYIALYENPCPVVELLELPRYTIPVVALAIGWPAERPRPRPRQGLQVLSSRDSYGDKVEERAKTLIGVYGERARRLFGYVFGPDGYYEAAEERLRLCLQRQGFSL